MLSKTTLGPRSSEAVTAKVDFPQDEHHFLWQIAHVHGRAHHRRSIDCAALLEEDAGKEATELKLRQRKHTQYGFESSYSGVPNRRTGLNKRTGWNISQKLINAQGLIIIIL